MLRKHFHETYMVSLIQFLKNWEYLLAMNDKAKKTITLKRGNKIVATVFTPYTFEKTDAEIEKLEATHQADQFKIKNLRKENEILKARLELLEKLNRTNNDPFE
ncbi:MULTISPECIES: hypothetical protein [Limosilactobacillus]|uniref:Transposase n=1 Tax=Limosilactobacillus balticus TaxID=2759747 RepID=A0ABS8RDV3_9LACO|nr:MULTISPECIES: hypothetical protein [Limosilactobacillus]MBB1129108.1 hypothetical protein [Limosilactobacillus balticus]MCC4352913.1 hypothetical protein [Limosilactobacillus reuteri]MCC4377714.1 hypothetical protein [Limosilactobacillus reuteri]MCD7139179.1 hypothetical protein [Limosilactobacillus balticus]